MLPVISQEKWRKGSQWITLVRRHAEVVVNDEIIFPLFKKFCKRWPPADHDTRRKTTEKYHRNCIPDEHYVQTLLSVDPNTGVSMYESDDIIKYLVQNYGDGNVPLSLCSCR
ncbi:glycosyltransferase BC10-like isoform X2 [Cucumis melo]|uniref:Glycosyltransferase BC10-like isoform X2 n=1 Tax=Cucumis melo TaxID=3656 RepID=A0ABM3L7H8_CUCME|nr:glycosyltransferase BC10-like isoform X2 [Cucumis melo]XP_050936903.1 glycosyltransferase BC10-like isoform X2 [Cucumis melo]XP_050945987.1 glycosyltransferase BC10-like isoform X2 [Cucumis melo]